MKQLKLITLFFALALSFMSASAQNVSINILTQNSGLVNLNGSVFLEVTICNTDPATSVPVYKLRPQISVPSAIVTIPASGHQLPAGWSITFNSGSVIRLSNGTDEVPANSCRTILIAMQGTALGGPSTISGNLLFSNGVAPGSASGPATPGDNPSDNSSQSTVQVQQGPACNIAVTAAAGNICNGGTTTLTATATGAAGTVEYSLDGLTFQSANTFTVGAGSYTVTAREVSNTSCSATSNTVTLVNPPAIIASASAGTIACNAGTTTLTVTASGGTGTLQYSLNAVTFQAGNTFTVAAGSYTVTVKDANNCTATTNTVTLTQPTAISASALPGTGTVACGGTTTLTVTASGGTGTLQYSLDGLTFQPGNTFTVGAGSYTVTVKDANLCTATATASVNSTLDNTNPTITAPASVSACTNSGCTATGVNLGTPVTADNCTVASVTNNAPAAFPVGATTVTWTVTDGSGNTATATQTVTVTDGTAPTIYVNQTALVPGVTGTSSSASPYLLPVKNGVKFKSILSATDMIGGYQMAGIPDGLGAFDNCDGTFTLLMNHEIGNTLGAVRAHGAIGSFVSKWVINKSTLQVISGSDLIQQVYLWNPGTQTNNAATSVFAFNRFCSSDLPPVSAFYNPVTGLGTKARLYMNGEEGGATGYQLATVVTGPDAGKAYVLGKFNLSTNGSGLTAVGASENSLANPFVQNKTVVISNNDGGTGIMTNSVSVYVGTKTNTGTEVDKAGLTNGTLYFVNVTGNPVEITNTTTRATNIVSGNAFTLSSTASTTFSRPEDGVWNPANPNQFFFVTTDQLDQVADGLGTQVGRSRLWRLNFTDITNPTLGGTIDILLDGTEGFNMLDNITADKFGHLILQEDVGNAAHNGKIWQYTIATDALVQIAKHDPARFGDRVGGVTTAATAPFNQDEESSGVVDMSDILGKGMYLTSDQAHYATGIPSNVVEGGQLLLMFNPESLGSTGTAFDTLRVCSGTGVNLGTPATSDNCTVASVTNNAPVIFPNGNTTVTWTVTDGSGNNATATQVVVVGCATVAIADPAVGQMNFTTLADAPQSANSLLFTQNYKLKIPFYNLNQLNIVPNGTIKMTVDLGTRMLVSPTFNLATAPLNTYFAWTQATVAGHVIITGTQVADIPADFAGTAVFEVKGSLSCTSTISTNITIVNTLANLTDEDLQNNAATLQYTLPITLSTSQVNVTCNGAGNGIINVTTSPGATVVIKNSSNVVVGNTNLVPGVYTVTATAAGDNPPGNTCSNSVTVTIVQPLVLAASVSGTSDNLCHGGNSGSITVTSTGGTAPYHYVITAGPTVNTTGANSGVFTGLTAGAYTITSTDANGCTATTTATVGEPAGTAPDLSLGSDITGSFFANSGTTQTIVYNVSEIIGNAAVGDTIRLTKVTGFTINFNVASSSVIVGGTTYTLDNARWKIDNSDPTFVSLILTDPSNLGNPGVLTCHASVNIAITLTRNTTDVSTFTLSARLRKANGELNLGNNLNSIILTSE